MLPAGAADKLLQWDLEFSPARKPGAVNSVPCPVDIATPDALEAKQNIALQLRSDLVKLVSKTDDGRPAQAFYRPKWPFVLRPFIRGHKLDLVPGFYDTICKPFQVRLSATAARITPANESDSEFFCHPERSRGIPSHSLQVIPRDSSILLRFAWNDNFTRSTFARILVSRCWVKP
jgi:hypothetical protein